MNNEPVKNFKLDDFLKTSPEQPASKLPIARSPAIDKAAIVSCGRFNFEATYAAQFCPECDHFDGLAVMNPGPNIPWHKAYAIRCCYPVERRTVIINAINKG